MKRKPSPVKKPRKPKQLVPLVLKEREALAAILNSDIMQKALGNAAIVKPGVFFGGSGTGVVQVKDAKTAMLMANNRLHEIRGWEQFETALFAQIEEPAVAKSKVEETYTTEE